MRTWLNDSGEWVSIQPKRFWTGFICPNTKKKIFIGDTVIYYSNYKDNFHHRYNFIKFTLSMYYNYSPRWSTFKLINND